MRISGSSGRSISQEGGVAPIPIIVIILLLLFHFVIVITIIIHLFVIGIHIPVDDVSTALFIPRP